MITAVDIDGYRVCKQRDCEVKFNDNPRALNCPQHRGTNSSRRVNRADRREHPLFICVDGEGTDRGRQHKYVLLGVGDVQREWPDGVKDISEIFGFLYEQYKANPGAVFAGFFLQYDWNMWLRLLPRDRAWMLYHPEARQRKCNHPMCRGRDRCQRGPWPVQFKGWEFDILDRKRFRLRPACGHRPVKGKGQCDCSQAAWMYICDAGPFFQTSLLSAVDPAKWSEPVVTPEEYKILVAGKGKRDSAVLDDDMRFYNRLENEILARLLDRYHTGLVKAGVHLKKDQWFGPGQAAQVWMRNTRELELSTESVRALADRKLKLRQLRATKVRQPETIYDALTASYYGGWFELPVHGHVPGTTYEYDINSAYPWAASHLPCLCGTWTTGTGTPSKLTHVWLTDPDNARTPRDRKIRLCRAIVKGTDPYLGGVPYRKPDGSVLRPRQAKGWWWQHELDAAKDAGLITDITYCEWIEYAPCGHKPPLRGLAGLYAERLRAGKNTPYGIALKLIYNSVYGKLCQSLGGSRYGNPAYASLITSACRTRILQAIATHPGKSSAVVMVATDGVYFMTPHPGIDAEISEYVSANPGKNDDGRLGRWSKGEKLGLTVFKPGVYWDDKARADIASGGTARFKSRGVNAEDFSKAINSLDAKFTAWGKKLPDLTQPDNWPAVKFCARFAQFSIKQALAWTEAESDETRQNARYRSQAGQVSENRELTQDSYPGIKRDVSDVRFDPDWGVYRSEPWDGGIHWDESTPYERKFGLEDMSDGFGEHDTPDGPVMMEFRSVLGVGLWRISVR